LVSPNLLRSVGLWIFLVALRGRGIDKLYQARAFEPRQIGGTMRMNLLGGKGVAGLTARIAMPTSPHRWFGMPMTAASATAGI
jgi:hypothetical protein